MEGTASLNFLFFFCISTIIFPLSAFYQSYQHTDTHSKYFSVQIMNSTRASPCFINLCILCPLIQYIAYKSKDSLYMPTKGEQKG